MKDDWIREPTDRGDAEPLAPDADEPQGIVHEDPQAGRILRDTENVPDSARALHPDLGGSVGPS